jgi:hypothetical protein
MWAPLYRRAGVCQDHGEQRYHEKKQAFIHQDARPFDDDMRQGVMTVNPGAHRDQPSTRVRHSPKDTVGTAVTRFWPDALESNPAERSPIPMKRVS